MKSAWHTLTDNALDDEIAVASIALMLAELCRKAAAVKSSDFRTLRRHALKAVSEELRSDANVVDDLNNTARSTHERVMQRARFYSKQILTESK